MKKKAVKNVWFFTAFVLRSITIPQVKLMEKAKNWGYVFRNFTLPPGNKMFR